MSKKKTKGALGIAKRCFVMSQAQFDKFKLKLRGQVNKFGKVLIIFFIVITNVQRKKMLIKMMSSQSFNYFKDTSRSRSNTSRSRSKLNNVSVIIHN
jgi:hypothetical protein